MCASPGVGSRAEAQASSAPRGLHTSAGADKLLGAEGRTPRRRAALAILAAVAAVAIVAVYASGPADSSASRGAPGADEPPSGMRAYLTISGGLLYTGDEYQQLWAEHTGGSGPVAEGAPLPPGTDRFEAALADLQMQRGAALGALALQAGFETATPTAYPGLPFDCIDDMCPSTTEPGAYVLVVASPPLEGAPDTPGRVTVRRHQAGSERVLPYESMLELGAFRRSVVDDPVVQARLERLRALITPDVARELRTSPDILTVDVSFVPDPGGAGL